MEYLTSSVFNGPSIALTRTSCPETPYSRRSTPAFAGDPSAVGELKLEDIDTEEIGTGITRLGENGRIGEGGETGLWRMEDLVGV